VTVAAALALAVTLTPLASQDEAEAADTAVAVTIDGDDIRADNVNGLTFKGFGVLSANSTSAVLMDYKAQNPAAYSQLLKELFGGENPIMRQVKIELGNDRNTSTGPNPATMRYEAEPANVARDPGFQLAADAKKINPDLKVSILRWRTPAWANTNDKIYNWQKNVALAAYRQYGYMVDYVNPGANETSVDRAWTITYAGRIQSDTVGYVSDDPALAGWSSPEEEALYRQIKIIVDDSSGLAGFGSYLRSNTNGFRDAIDVVGYHYTTDDDSSGNFKWAADTADLEIWNSEAQATFSNSAFRPNNNMVDTAAQAPRVEGTQLGGVNGPLEMANTIVKGYVNSRRTHFIYQPAIGSFYEGGQYSHKELVSARDPWSGWIHYDAGLVMLEHFSDFAVTGWENDTNTAGIWRGVTAASQTTATGTNPVNGRAGGANHVTLAAPDKSDFSTVIVNDSQYTNTYTFTVQDMAIPADADLEVWETRAADPGQQFNSNYKKHVATVAPGDDGKYVVTIKPFSIVTVTTLDVASDPEVTAPLPVEGDRTVLDIEENGDGVLWQDDFEYGDKTVPVFDSNGNPTTATESFIDSRGGDTGADPLYTWDRNGAFEAYKEGDGYVLRQQLDQAEYGLGSAWNAGDPITGIGDFRWVNYKASVDVRFDKDVTSSNYAAVGVRSTGGDNSQNLSSAPYVLRLDRTGNWYLQNFGANRATGSVPVEVGEWHKLALQAAGNTVTAYIDGVQVASYTDPTPVLSGRVDLASGFYWTSFDNLKIEKLPTYVAYYTERLDNMEMNDLASPPNTKLVYTGTWSHRNGEGMYNYQRSLSSTSTAGSTVSYTFTGTGLDIMGLNGAAATLKLTVDGVTLSSTDKTWSRSAYWRTNYTLRGLPYGPHTVTLTVLSGSVTVDSFDTIGRPVATPEAIDVSAIEAALEATADIVKTPEFSDADWASFSLARAHAESAVANPEAYGLDAEGPAAIAARLQATSLPGAWVLPTFNLATWKGQAPALPATVVATNADDGSTKSFPITWDLAAANFNQAWQSVTITGRYQHLETTATVEIVPEGLVYFVDGNGVASGLGTGTSALGYVSPAWTAIKALVESNGGTLLNDKPDQAQGSSTWGHHGHANGGGSATMSYKGIEAGTYNKLTTTGMYTSNQVGASVRYTFTLPAGKYALAYGSYTWWASSARTTRTYIDYGTASSANYLVQFALNTATPSYVGTHEVELAEAGTVTLRLQAISQAQSPMFSWAGVYKVIPTDVTLTPATAVTRPGKTVAFDGRVVLSTGGTSTDLNWAVTGATSADTSIANGVLSVGADEAVGTVLTVTATSTGDATKSASATVTVKDKSELARLVAEAAALDPENFTTASWAPVKVAWDAGEDVLADDDVPQADVDDAAATLQSALDALVVRPATLSEPVLSGTGAVGSTLTLAVSASPSDAGLLYQWYRGTSYISGVSGTSYVVQPADAGLLIKVKVTASRTGAVSVVKYSNGIQVAEQIKVTKKALPAAGVVGDTLTLDLVYTPTDAVPQVQWYRGTSWIATASGLTYTLTAADSGSEVKAKVTLTKTGMDTVVVYSNGTAVSGPPAPSVKVAALSPASQVAVGETMTLDLQVAPSNATVKIEWFKGSSLLRDSAGLLVTGLSYTPTNADALKDLVVKVTVTADGFAPVVRYSNHVIVGPAV
jgi:hypothetical protein